MGLLRLILALAVVVTHSQPLFGVVSVGGLMAVQSFFIISGFYMAMILNEKYTGPGSYGLFITNRFLRLYPAYWVVLALTVTMTFAQWNIFGEGFRVVPYLHYFNLIGIKSRLYITFTNLFMFGQDSIMFMKLSPEGALAFASNFRDAGTAFPPVFRFLFVPQAWSLGIELMFYVLAPLLVRRGNWKILAIISGSLFLRFYIYGIGFEHDPWTYRFFPAELAFFLFGVLSYRLYERYRGMNIRKEVLLAVFLGVIAFTLLYQFAPKLLIRGQSLNQWGYYMVLVFAIPAMFLFTKGSRLDAYLGELSYPIYISHIFVLNATTYKLFKGGHHYQLYLFSFVLVLVFSMLLVHLLIRPIEKFRQARVNARRQDVLKNQKETLNVPERT